MSRLAVAAASIFLINMTSSSFLIRSVYYEQPGCARGERLKVIMEGFVTIHGLTDQEKTHFLYIFCIGKAMDRDKRLW